jgi:hypothetical protein
MRLMQSRFRWRNHHFVIWDHQLRFSRHGTPTLYHCTILTHSEPYRRKCSLSADVMTPERLIKFAARQADPRIDPKGFIADRDIELEY